MGLASIAFLALVGVVIPWRAFAAARILDAAPPAPKRVVFLSAITAHVLIAGLALLAAREARLDAFPWPPARPWLGLALAAAFVGVALAQARRAWNRRSPRERRRLALIMPARRAELPAWALVAASAGICEEIAYRGVLVSLLEPWLTWWGAAGVAIACFSLAHAVQGPRAIASCAVFAAAFHALVRITGDLAAAILAHAAYDFLVAIVLIELVRRESASRMATPLAPTDGSAAT